MNTKYYIKSAGNLTAARRKAICFGLENNQRRFGTSRMTYDVLEHYTSSPSNNGFTASGCGFCKIAVSYKEDGKIKTDIELLMYSCSRNFDDPAVIEKFESAIKKRAEMDCRKALFHLYPNTMPSDAVNFMMQHYANFPKQVMFEIAHEAYISDDCVIEFADFLEYFDDMVSKEEASQWLNDRIYGMNYQATESVVRGDDVVPAVATESVVRGDDVVPAVATESVVAVTMTSVSSVANLHYYITHPCDGIRPTWNRVVAGPFANKDELMKSAISLISSCEDGCELGYILDYHVVASEKRVGNGKSLRNDWICLANKLGESKNESIQAVIQEKLKDFPDSPCSDDLYKDLDDLSLEEIIKMFG